MKLGNKFFIILFKFFFFITYNAYGNEEISTSQLLNIEKIKPSFEEVEEKNSDEVISQLVNKNIRLAALIIRAAPIMETLTGIMIAGFIFYSGKLINSGELEVNNFFSFLAAMMLAYQPIRSLATINMAIYQGATASKRIFNVIQYYLLTVIYSL